MNKCLLKVDDSIEIRIGEHNGSVKPALLVTIHGRPYRVGMFSSADHAKWFADVFEDLEKKMLANAQSHIK